MIQILELFIQIVKSVQQGATTLELVKMKITSICNGSVVMQDSLKLFLQIFI